MIYDFYSTRRMPRHLREAIRLLALVRGERHWQIHNRTLARGLKQLWRESGLGEWPGRERLEAGKVKVKPKPVAEEEGELLP